MSEAFRKLLKQSYRGVHPELLDQVIPNKAFKTDDRNSPDSYDRLTNESPFSHYAWAFLRRNRFYQAELDNMNLGYGIELWGHKSHAGTPANYGLMNAKPYEQLHDQGVAIEWEGIHSFFNRHWQRNSQQPSFRAQLDFPAIQFHIVFDLDDVLGPSANAIDIQIKLAREMLLRRAAKMGLNPKEPAQRPNKNMKARLRSMLRVADLLSPERRRSGDGYELVWDINSQPSKLAVAERLLPCDLEDCISDDQKAKKASALAISAFKAIYHWELLNWLRFDPWHQILLSEEKQPANVEVGDETDDTESGS